MNGSGISFDFLRKIDIDLANTTGKSGDVLFIITIVLALISLILLTWVIVIPLLFFKKQSGKKADYLNVINKVVCLVFILFKTILYMPAMDILLRTVYSTFHSSIVNQQTAIIRYLVCSLALLLFPMLLFYLDRVFNIRVPTSIHADRIPWCAPFSKLTHFDLLLKLLLIVSNSLDTSGQFIIIEIVALLLGFAFIAIYRLLFVPHFNINVDYLYKTRDFTLFTVMLIGILCTLLQDQNNYDIVYFLVLIPVVNLAWYTVDKLRRIHILKLLKRKGLQLESENEYALHAVTTVVKESLSLNLRESQEHFGQFLDLVISHIEECLDNACICNELENYQDLVRLKMEYSQDVFPLSKHQQIIYKRIIDDRGIIGSHSSFTNLNKLRKASILEGNEAELHSISSYKDEKESGNKYAEISSYDTPQISQPQKLQKQQLNLLPNTHKRPPQEVIQNDHVVKVNMNETQHRFLSEIIYLYVFNIMEKFPNSIQIQLYVNYFTLFFRKRDLLTIFQMRHFAHNKFGTVDSICYAINEMYLLEEAGLAKKLKEDSSQELFSQNHSNDQGFDSNSNSKLNNQLDGDYFIKIHQLNESFSQSIENLAQSVLQFWRQLKNTTLDVQQSIDSGFTISNNARQVFCLFNQIDEVSKFKDFRTFFQIALVQLHILNDPVGYEIYIGKMKSILEINQVFQKNYSMQHSKGMSQQDYESSNFLIVDANGRNFGKIILFNKNLRQLLGRTDQEIKNLTIDDLMPSPIQTRHALFLKRFNQTGQSWILNNKTTMFIKKQNGFVTPVELLIKFHYSLDYNYTFLATFKPLEELCPFENGAKYRIDQLIFFIVDSDQEGCITEFSESCKQLEEYGLRMNTDSSAITKRIKDFVKDLDYDHVRATRAERVSKNEIYEAVHELDLSCLQDYNKSSANSKQWRIGTCKAKTRIFEERYSDGILDLNIFCFSLFKQDTTPNSGTQFNKDILVSFAQFQNESGFNQRMHSNVIKSPKERNNLTQNREQSKHEANDDNKQIKSNLKPQKNQKQIQQQHEEELVDHGGADFSQSMSISSSSGQGSGSMTLLSEFRSFNMLTLTEQSKTPRTLMMIVRLIILLYIIMMAVASVNLWINVSRQSQSETDIHTVKYSYDRQLNLANNLVMLRTLVNIANDNERDRSPIINGSRFTWYIPYQEQAINDLKTANTHLQQSKFEKTPDFYKFENSKNTVLQNLGEDNKPYDQVMYQQVAFATYISQLTELNKEPRKSFIGNISLLQLNGIDPGQVYSPTDHEQSIYFIASNGLSPLRRVVIDSCFYYAREAEDHANSSQTTTLITAIMSIVSIVIIGLIISPMLTRAETRKYFAILYFLKIPKPLFDGLIQNCEYLLNMKDEKRFFQIKKDYQKLLGFKLITEKYELDCLQKEDEQQDYKGPKSGEIDSLNDHLHSSDLMFINSSIGVSSTPSIHHGPLKGSSSNNQFKQSKNRIFDHSIIEEVDENMGGEGQSMRELINQHFSTKKASNQHSGANIGESTFGKINEEVKEYKPRSGSIQKLEHSKDQHLNAKKDKQMKDHQASQISSSAQSDRSPSARNVKSSEDDDEEEAKAKQQELINLQNAITLSNEHLVQRSIVRRRMIMIATTLSLIVLLSTYFLIAYFLSIRTFNTASQVIESLETVFNKGGCFDFTSSFIKANFIRNSSILVRSAENTANGATAQMYYSASEYYLDFCAKQEVEYLNLRKANPPYFKELEEYMEILESNQICDRGYNSSKTHLVPVCHEALNGILKQGLSNAYSYMYNFLQKLSLRFDVAGPTARRTEEFLRELTDDPTLIAIIDIKARLLTPLLDALNIKAMESVINYIHKLLNDSMTAFIIFAVLMTIGLIIILFTGFKIMKKSMLDTNILLRIIPFEHLPKEYREDIKEFFKQ